MKLRLSSKDLISADYTIECAVLQIVTEYMEVIGNEQYEMYRDLLKKYKKMLKDAPGKELDLRFEIHQAKTMISRFKKVKQALAYITMEKLNNLDEEASAQIDVILKYRDMLWF